MNRYLTIDKIALSYISGDSFLLQIKYTFCGLSRFKAFTVPLYNNSNNFIYFNAADETIVGVYTTLQTNNLPHIIYIKAYRNNTNVNLLDIDGDTTVASFDEQRVEELANNSYYSNLYSAETTSRIDFIANSRYNTNLYNTETTSRIDFIANSRYNTNLYNTDTTSRIDFIANSRYNTNLYNTETTSRINYLIDQKISSVPGGLTYANIITITSNYTATTQETIILANNTTDITVTLPSINSNNKGKNYIIKKISNNTNTVSINAATNNTIDGNTSHVLSTVNQFISIISDGSNNWYIIAR